MEKQFVRKRKLQCNDVAQTPVTPDSLDAMLCVRHFVILGGNVEAATKSRRYDHVAILEHHNGACVNNWQRCISF